MAEKSQITNQKSPIELAPAPLCPHCKAELSEVGQYSWQGSSLWVILGVFCNKCRVLLKLTIVPAQAIPSDDPDAPRIYRPM